MAFVSNSSHMHHGLSSAQIAIMTSYLFHVKITTHHKDQIETCWFTTYDCYARHQAFDKKNNVYSVHASFTLLLWDAGALHDENRDGFNQYSLYLTFHLNHKQDHCNLHSILVILELLYILNCAYQKSRLLCTMSVQL